MRGKSIRDTDRHFWTIDNDGSQPHPTNIEVPYSGIDEDIAPGEVSMNDLRRRVVKVSDRSA